MRLLILGGTGFIGPHQVRYALARGHEVTLFNRGRSKTAVPGAVTRLVGDRNGALAALRGQKWDGVIDNSGFYPHQVRSTAQFLNANVGNYLFVSSVSAYGDQLEPGQPETEPPLATVDQPVDDEEPPYGPSYGARKARCEVEVLNAFGPERTTIIRPGFITGAGDPTDRLRHWLARAAHNRDIMVPGDPVAPVQIIDARDLGEWMVRLMEDGNGGTFNAVGPRQPLTAKEIVTALVSAVTSDAGLTWVPWEFLQTRGVGEFAYLPLLRPSSWALMSVGNRAAVESGLTFRSLEDTTADMYGEYVLMADTIERFGLRSGISPETERQILRHWRRETGHSHSAQQQ